MEFAPATEEELAIFSDHRYNYICRRDGTMVVNPYQYVKVNSCLENRRGSSLMTDAYLMEAECIHGVVWYECTECPQQEEPDHRQPNFD